MLLLNIHDLWNDYIVHHLKLDYHRAKYSDLRLAFQIMSRSELSDRFSFQVITFPHSKLDVVLKWDSANSNFDKILNFLLGINHQSFQRGELWVILHRNPRALTVPTAERRFHWNLPSNQPSEIFLHLVRQKIDCLQQIISMANLRYCWKLHMLMTCFVFDKTSKISP